MKLRPLPRPQLLVEELEPRILYSADVAALFGAGHWTSGAEVRVIDVGTPATSNQNAVAATTQSVREIVFVDSRVPDYLRLLDDLRAQRGNARALDVVVLAPGEDGIDQIGKVLATEQGLGAIHIISHGAEARVALGNSDLDLETLVRDANDIARWGDALTADADILLYGCDVAANADGQALVQALARLTGADVAASEDVTGSSLRGGDWTLEYATGRIETRLAVGAAAQQAWVGTLAITQDNASSAATSGAASSLTFSHTVGSGSDGLLVVEVAIGAKEPVTSVTYGGTPMTFLAGQTQSGNKERVELWYLKAPPTGTADIVVSLGANKLFVAGATSFFGVDQTTPFGTPFGAQGSGGTPTVVVASASGEVVLDIAARRDADTSSVGAGQSQLWTNTNGNGNADAWGGSSTEPGAASVTMSWSTSGAGAGEWAAIAVAMKPAAIAAPVLTMTGTTLAYTENAAATAIDPDLTVTDADSANLTGATVTISANYANGQDVLAFTDQLGITGSWDAGSGVLTLTGTATVANYQAALRTVTYVNSSDAPSVTTRTVSFVVSDGAQDSTAATRDVSVAAVNDAPVVTIVPPSYSATEQTPLALHGTGMSVADVDAGAAAINLTLSVGAGILTVGEGTTGVSTGGSGTGSVLVIGTLTQLNNLLAGNLGSTISYLNTSDAPPASTTLTVSLNDGGVAGAGGPQTGSDTAVIDISATNDAPAGLPTIGGTATEDQTITADTSGITDADGLGAFAYQWLRGGVAIGGATSSTYTLGDADVGAQMSVRVTYTDGGGTAEGPLTSAPTAVVTNVNSPPVGVPTISGVATEDQTLTADTSGISDADGLGAFAYQWLRGGVAIGGATGNTYTLTDADVGAQISVRVSYTDGHGTAEGPLTSAPTAAVANVNDAPVGVPTISGTATEDQTLTANIGGIGDADGLGAFSYQWLRGGVAIGGATGNTYTLGDADVGAQISVRVTYTDGGGTAEGPLTSALTAAVANVNDAPTGVPTISGTPTEDQTLTADTSGLSDADGLGAFAYQWLRGGVAIGGATSSTYTLGDADVGAQMSVRVTYTDGGGTAEGPLTSAPTAAVANVNDAPLGVPTISGTASKGQTLTADTASIGDADGLGAFSYQWLRDGVAIGGATAATHLLGAADVGAQISVRVTYTDGHSTAEGPLTSAQTAVVTNVNSPPVGVPTIGGTATEDQTLTADTSGLSDADGLGAFAYQWLRGGVAIGGATSSTYTLGDADVGAQMSVRVTYTDGGGTAEGPLTSAPTAAVANVNDAPLGVPTISGTASKGQTLTADTATIGDADGLGAFSYQWLRDGVAIGGATAATHLLGAADVGAQISVRVTYTDGHGTAEGPLTSAQTAVVTNVNSPPVGVPTIGGTATEDQTLTADTSGLSDADGLGAFSYQWLRGGVAIGGATGNTYTLGDADVGAQISVRVSYTDGGGTLEGPLTSAPTAAVANVNDAPVGVPTISGTATEDQTLTANIGGIGDADGLGAFAYQWLRGGVAIGGATSSTYTLGDADVGAQLTVRVTYTDGGGTAEGPLTSTPTAAVANVNDAPVGVPTIGGTPTEDQTLTSDTSGIGDADGLGAFAYQWLRGGVAVGGATGSSYTLGDADVGAQMSVRVTYTDGGGTAEGPLTSAPTAAVANVNDAPLGVPTISGTASKGQTLTADTAGIGDADGLGAFSYQWLRDGVAIGGATAATHLLGAADVGTQISVQVSYTDGHGTAEGPLTSAPTAVVTHVNSPPVGVPTISGVATEDQTLTADTSGISDADGLGTFAYQWLRGGVAVGGATSSTYTLGDADVGAQISVHVTYPDGGGTAEGPLTSAPTAPVANVNDAAAGVPTISGAASKGQTLTSHTDGISDADGLGAFAYQWLRDGVAIGGATAATHLLGAADVGAQISVRVTYTDGHGTAEGPLTSAQTAVVTNVNSPPVGVPTIGGSATEDQTLTADTSDISDADGVGAFAYQWLRGGVAIGGATSSTYTLGDADVGAQMSVRVSYTDGGGTAEGPLTSAPTAAVANVNDTPMGVPTISGTASKGQTLTADTSGISDADGLGAFGYQWLRDGVAIGGATATSHLLGSADVGTQISVRVSYTDGHGTAEGPLTSAPTAVVTHVNSPPVGVPTISGTATEDQTLTANTSGLSDADGLGAFAYQWLRGGAAVGGATTSTYTLGDADVGAQMSVRVSYTDGGGTAEGPLTSAPTAAVANVNDTPMGVPTISGTASKGQTLTANTGSISDADGLGAFKHQWLRDGVVVGGATGSSYTIGDTDVGKQFSVRVTYTDGHGTAEGPLTSAPTAAVANVNDAPLGVPTISGTASKGQTLTADTATIGDADGLGAFSYQWLRDGVAIGGATAATHLLGAADVGAQISVRVTYTDGHGTAEGPLTSAQTAVVTNVNSPPVGVPTISGVATEDQTLTADTSGIGDADGLGAFSYQWLRGGVAIGGATASTYMLGDADVGVQISVRVTYTDGGGTAEGPLTSAPTATVANVDDAAVIGGSSNGSVSEDGVLTASGGLTITDPDADQSAFQPRNEVTGAYGSFSIDAAGAWTYRLNNTAAVVQQLAAGKTMTESFPIVSSDGTTTTITLTVSGANDAPVMTNATITLRAGETVVLSPALLDATDPDGQQRLVFAVSEVTNGRFELVANPGAAIDHFNYADLAAGYVRFVSSANGAAPAFRIAATDGNLTSAPMSARVVFDSSSVTNRPIVDLDSNMVPGAGPVSPNEPGNDLSAYADDVRTSPSADNESVAPTKLEPSPFTGEALGAALERLVSPGSSPSVLTSTPAVPRDAVVSLEGRGQTATIELVEGIALDEYYVRLVSLSVADQGSSGREMKFAAGDVIAAPDAANDDSSPEFAVSAAQMTGIALTAGTVWWALRVGGLLTSLLASMPTWRHVDLLPILRESQGEEVDWGTEDAEAARDEDAVGQVLDASTARGPA